MQSNVFKMIKAFGIWFHFNFCGHKWQWFSVGVFFALFYPKTKHCSDRFINQKEIKKKTQANTNIYHKIYCLYFFALV